MDDELKQLKLDKENLINSNESKDKEITKLGNELDEAYGVVTKLEEARIVLNRLLGPGGAINERERNKFMKAQGYTDDQIKQHDDKDQANQQSTANAGNQLAVTPGGNKKMSAASKNMLSGNNDYFYKAG